jgi:DNA-directed RNA polymerase subunit alpha
MNDYGIQMPDGVHVEQSTDTDGHFVIQPLERGYGITIGNAFRRVMLSSLRGVAITAIRIDGVQHEFSTIPNVSEDVADIILNLKGVRLKSETSTAGNISIELEGPGMWTAKDIADATSEFEILNPDHHIATLDDGAKLLVELRIGAGRGYVPAEKLDIEIVTDGSVTPEEAITQAAVILREHVSLFIKVDAEPEQVVQEKEVDAEVQRMRGLFMQSVDELDLSVRAHNCLKAANIKTIGDLVRREESEMLKFRNFGRKSLQELMEVLDERGLKFGMDVDKYVENV